MRNISWCQLLPKVGKLFVRRRLALGNEGRAGDLPGKATVVAFEKGILQKKDGRLRGM